jgi:flagellar motor switch protein FliM
MTDEDENLENTDDAAAWEAMLAGGGDEQESDGSEERILDQSGIDALLGMESSNAKSDRGIKAVIDRALMSYERLPMLEVVFDRFTRSLSTSIRTLTGENADVDILSLTSLRFSDYIDTVPMPSLIGIFKVQEWDNFGLLYSDGNLIYSFLEILFGGRKLGQPIRFDGRPFTMIEQGVFRQICEMILSELTLAFEPLSPSTFSFDRIETNPRFATISRPGDAVIVFDIRISMEDKVGKTSILIPYATLEPVREMLMQVFVGEKFGKDPAWQLNLEHEITNAQLNLEAVLGRKEATLLDIMKLNVGDTIIFDTKHEEPINIECEKINMMSGKVGCIDNKIAISITKTIHDKLEELIE